MAAKAKKKTRCPFQNECERKCEYEGSELKCDYYKNNAVGDSVIPDQEELRKMYDKLEDDKRLEEELKGINLPEELENTSSTFDVSKVAGELSSGGEIKMIELGRLIPSKDNIFNVENDITPLAEDIKLNGLLSPLTVCSAGEEGFYRIISGHRRYKALCEVYNNSFEVPCFVTVPKSKASEKYMLIQANMASCQITYGDINKARKLAEKCLLELKAEGVEFPGKMRKHVAELLKVSEAKLAKTKFISKNLNSDIQQLSDLDFSFDNKYKVAHWPKEMQQKLYDKKLKGGKYFGEVWDYDNKIKNGEDPFVKQKKEKPKLHPEDMWCLYVSPAKKCDNYENFRTYVGVPISKFGITFSCETACCKYCDFNEICPAACKVAKDTLSVRKDKYPEISFLIYKSRLAIRFLLLQKGFDEQKINDLASLDGYTFVNSFSNLVKDSYSEYFNLRDLLYYLHLLKITPNEFFDIVKNHTDGPRELEKDIKPKWEIYLGESAGEDT